MIDGKGKVDLSPPQVGDLLWEPDDDRWELILRVDRVSKRQEWGWVVYYHALNSFPDSPGGVFSEELTERCVKDGDVIVFRRGEAL